MTLKLRSIVLISWLTGISVVAAGQSNVNLKSIKLDTDTLINTTLKQLADSDSVQLLEYSKIKYPDFSVIDERMVYIDYRSNNEFKERMKNYFSDLNSDVEIPYPIPTESEISRNIDKSELTNLKGIYIHPESLKGSDILFFNDIQYRYMISDSSLYWYTMEGWVKYDIVNIKKENGNIDFTLNNGTIYQIKEIGNGIQIWKNTRLNKRNESFSSFSRMIKLEKALSLPILNIINTGEFDDYYDGFDNLELESLYKR